MPMTGLARKHHPSGALRLGRRTDHLWSGDNLGAMDTTLDRVTTNSTLKDVAGCSFLLSMLQSLGHSLRDAAGDAPAVPKRLFSSYTA
jgi:hypothetical protein